MLRATTELLDEVGYDGVGYEDVAARAGVHRTTVYRRWPSKADLVSDALELHSEERVPVPDTGSLRGDLRSLAAAIAANISPAGGSRRSPSIVAAAAHSPEVAQAVHHFMSRRVAMTQLVVDQAIGRGELPSTTDPNLIIEALVAPLWFRLLLTGEPLDDDFLDRLVELVASGAGA